VSQIAEIGGLPEGILDAWEITGKRPEAKNTWDLLRNNNLQMPGKFQPRCRFDRMYVRHAEPKVVKVEYFELCGIERLKSCQRFCSDHWGLLAHLNILSKMPKWWGCVGVCLGGGLNGSLTHLFKQKMNSILYIKQVRQWNKDTWVSTHWTRICVWILQVDRTKTNRKKALGDQQI